MIAGAHGFHARPFRVLTMNKPDICLVYPPYYNQSVHLVPPIGILKLAAYLEQRGRGVIVDDLVLALAEGQLPLDATLPDACADRLIASEADVFGFSVQALTISTAISIAERIKRIKPDVRIIFGGYGVSFESTRFLELTTAIDAIIVGEGEVTLAELLDAWDSGRNLSDVPGIVHRERKEFPARYNGPRDLISNLDELPFPAYHLIGDHNRYVAVTQSKASYNQPFPIDAGRGCSFTCTFCSSCLMFARKVRARSPANVIEEVRFLRDSWGVRQFLMTYDLFDFDKEYVRDFCRQMIEADLDVAWECRCRIELLDAETVAIMKRAGCFHVLFGIESGSKRTLKAIRKTTNLSRMRERIEMVVSGGLVPIFSFVVGFPEEKPEDVDETLKLGLFCRLAGDSYVSLHMPTPLPGTELWHQSKDMLVLSNMTGDMASGVSFSAGKDLLPEDLERIRKHPDLFSTFYNINPPHLGVESVFFLHRVWATLTSLYSRTIYTYASGSESIWTLIAAYRRELPADDLAAIVDFNRPIDFEQIARTFGEFLSAHLHDAHDQPIGSVMMYEWARSLAWMRPQGVEREAGVTRRATVTADEAPNHVPMWRAGVETALLAFDVSREAILSQRFEATEHAKILVPRGRFDYSELEVPIELIELVGNYPVFTASMDEDVIKCLNELGAIDALWWVPRGATVSTERNAARLELAGREEATTPFLEPVARC